jgi:hypothetical protein
MKGMIYRDGKFISVLSDTDANTLYEELPRNKKSRGTKGKKKSKSTRLKKQG